MSTGTLNGERAIRQRLHLPAWGVPWCDAELDGEVALSGAASAVLADLTLVGTVIDGGPFQGRSSYRICGGAGGWGRSVAAKDYSNDAGVKFSTVLLDAAQASGETLDASTIPSGTLGSKFVRQAGPASRVLEQLSPQNWYVGEDGITRIGRRARVEVTTELTLQAGTDKARGVLALAADQIAQLVPGAVVDGIEAIDVQHELADKTLRTTVWGASAAQASVRLSVLGRLIRALMPDYAYRGGPYEYRVVAAEGDRWNLQLVRKSLGLPDLRRVRVRPGIAGAAAELKLGSLVLVAFVNADPTRPVIVAAEDEEGPGFAPTRLDLVGVDDIVAAAAAPGRVLRYGDTVMMPVGSAGTPTPTVLVANPIGTSSLSRVRA